MQQAKSVRRLILGLALIAFGIVLLWKRDAFLADIMHLLALVVAFGGLAELIWWGYRRLRPQAGDCPTRDLVLALGSLLLGGAMLIFPSLHQYLVPLLFGCYLLLNGIVKCIDSFLAVRNHTGHLLSQLLPAVFYLTFGMILLFSPRYHLRSVLWIASIYCLLLGTTNLADFALMLIPVRTRHNLRRRFRFTPPVIVTLLLPHKALLRLNRYLTQNQGHTAADFEDIALKKEDAPPDLEVFVHVSDNADMRIGHVDLCFENQVTAYGNYDDSTVTPLGTGDGVLIRCAREQYLPFCLAFHQTTIFSFGLRLSPAQQEAVRQRIRQISSQTEEWLPPIPPICAARPSAPADMPPIRTMRAACIRRRAPVFSSSPPAGSVPSLSCPPTAPF